MRHGSNMGHGSNYRHGSNMRHGSNIIIYNILLDKLRQSIHEKIVFC